MSQPLIRIRGASRSFGGTEPVLRNIDLDLYCGRVTALLGPSGSGKSTLLRAIAGLERLDAGEIRDGDTLWSGGKTHLAPEHRNVGMVFQDFALFPHLTAAENVAFGLRNLTKAERRERAVTLLRGAELAQRADAYPHELSGGEQQRVALARALAVQPDVVLMDEPFSGLDRRLRAELRGETVARLRAAGTASLIVTHDAEEAMEVADDIALIFDGEIIQAGHPEEVYLDPVSITAARLLGDVQTWTGTVEAGQIVCPLGKLAAPGIANGARATILIRPDGVERDASGCSAKVTEKRIHAGRARLTARTANGETWRVETRLWDSAELGETIHLALNPAFTKVFPE